MLCLSKEDIPNATTLDEIMDAVESAMQLNEGNELGLMWFNCGSFTTTFINK